MKWKYIKFLCAKEEKTHLYVLPICYIKYHLCGPCHIYSNMQLCKRTHFFGFCQVASVKTNAAFCSSAALPTPVPSWFLCSVESLFCSHSGCYKWLGVGVSRNSLIFIPTEDGSRQSVAARLSSPSLEHNGIFSKLGKLD